MKTIEMSLRATFGNRGNPIRLLKSSLLRRYRSSQRLPRVFFISLFNLKCIEKRGYYG